MEMRWLDWLWLKVRTILRHPWHSLISLLAAIGGLIFLVGRFLKRVVLWLWRQLWRLGNISLWGWIKGLTYAFLGICILGFLITILLITYPETKVPDFQPVDQHVYLSQGAGWTGGQNMPLRQLFYYTPQGASVKDIRYSWFVNLEVPWGKTKFSDPQRMSAYGFLVDKQPTEQNPGNLPVGFTSHYDSRFGEQVLDLTCAACHTGELTVNKNGKRYGLRIDGGPAMHAFTAMHIGDFAPELLGSLTATYLNPFKFVRFARLVLGPSYPQSRWKLHHQLGTVIGELLHQAVNDKSRHLYPTEEGPGRIDALARIGNTVFGDELSSVNYKVGNAPVRYPPLWDIWKFDYVQYNASVRQPMTRNVSESLGTGASAELLNSYGAPIPRDQQFDTSVMINNLGQLETALWSLEPPKWSEDCLGKIDWDKAKRGQALFAKSCQHCHGPFPASDPIKEWFAYLKTPGYKQQVLDSWQTFLNGFYETPAQTPGTAIQNNNQETLPSAVKTVQPQIGITLSPGEQQQANLHEEKPIPFTVLFPAAHEEGHEEKSETKPFVPLATLQPAGHTEESREQESRQLGSDRTPIKGTAPRIDSNYDLPLWMMQPLTVQDVGTDPTAAVNFVNKKIDVTKLGLNPATASEGMRTLLENDLNGKTDAYAKDILRLMGKDTISVPDQKNKKIPVIETLRPEDRSALRQAALDVLNLPKQRQVAKDSADQGALNYDIAQYRDAISTGESRVNNFLAAMDLNALNTGVALRLIVFSTRQRFYDQRRYTLPERNELNGFGELDVPEPLPQYKPRPLAGIWAAGPFLHNGSVPTIYQLLLPADQRDKKFFVGTRDFDPVNLGLSTQAPTKGGFWLDTSITGNSNVGHEFRKGYIKWQAGGPPRYGVIGPEWTEEDRRDIIEYLKVHRDDHKIDPAKDMDGYLREGLDTRNVCQ
jgi:mono/diheme cytochrome c family protein